MSRQQEFDQTNNLGYPLLSDESRTIAKQFGVKRMGPLPSKRATFVIAADGTLLAEISSETNMAQHADDALQVLRDHAAK